MLKWLRNLLDDPNDSAKHCDLYKDKAAGSCAHVDGPLCDFPGCPMLKDYRERNFRALWGGCKKGDRCQCTSAVQQGRCANRDEDAIARINANVQHGRAMERLTDEAIDRIVGGMYQPIGFGGHPSQYTNWCREFARAVIEAADAAGVQEVDRG